MTVPSCDTAWLFPLVRFTLNVVNLVASQEIFFYKFASASYVA